MPQNCYVISQGGRCHLSVHWHRTCYLASPTLHSTNIWCGCCCWPRSYAQLSQRMPARSSAAASGVLRHATRGQVILPYVCSSMYVPLCEPLCACVCPCAWVVCPCMNLCACMLCPCAWSVCPCIYPSACFAPVCTCVLSNVYMCVPVVSPCMCTPVCAHVCTPVHVSLCMYVASVCVSSCAHV